MTNDDNFPWLSSFFFYLIIWTKAIQFCAKCCLPLPSISFSGIDKALSRRVTYEASVCNVVLDVHVKRYDMCISCSFTCTCKTRLCTGKRNVPFWERQSTTPNKGIDAVYRYFRYRKDRVIIFVTIRIWIYLRSALNSIANYYKKPAIKEKSSIVGIINRQMMFFVIWRMYHFPEYWR